MTRRNHVGLPFLLLSIVPLLLAGSGCATTNPGVEKEAKPADLDTLLQMGGKAHALVVWTSSRTGTPHLFIMKSDGTEEKQLTKGPHTDWYPRFSPDGKRILFTRSVEKGFVRESDSNLEHVWDLYTVDPEGNQQTKVVENASWGSWISNDEILFVRGTKLMRVKLGGEGDDAKPKKVFDVSRHPSLSGAVVRAPELARDGHALAMTLGGARRQVGLWDLKEKSWTQVARGSEITWAPDSAAVLWVNPSGKELSEILRAQLEEGSPPEKIEPEAMALVDMQGKRSHEAFPRLSSDGKWLVFGAGATGLESDLEDYELYLFEVGSKVSPTRMTFHSGNDRWPDIFVGPAGEAPAAKADQGAEESGGAAAPAEKPAEGEAPDTKAAPAEKAAETQEEPAATDTEAATDEGGEPASAAAGKGKSKGKPKAKTGNNGKKKRR